MIEWREKNRRADVIRKELGCIPTCAAMGDVTHTEGCPVKRQRVQWLEWPIREIGRWCGVR